MTTEKIIPDRSELVGKTFHHKGASGFEYVFTILRLERAGDRFAVDTFMGNSTTISPAGETTFFTNWVISAYYFEKRIKSGVYKLLE